MNPHGSQCTCTHSSFGIKWEISCSWNHWQGWVKTKYKTPVIYTAIISCQLFLPFWYCAIVKWLYNEISLAKSFTHSYVIQIYCIFAVWHMVYTTLSGNVGLRTLILCCAGQGFWHVCWSENNLSLSLLPDMPTSTTKPTKKLIRILCFPS
jgi:hypothetical protein